MIRKNQHDELNIIFTPKSMQNNVYFGSLAVNNLPLKRYLQILLKKDCTKKGNCKYLYTIYIYQVYKYEMWI